MSETESLTPGLRPAYSRCSFVSSTAALHKRRMNRNPVNVVKFVDGGRAA